MQNINAIENLYNGFCSTNTLWDGKFHGLEQFAYSNLKYNSFHRDVQQKLRLGQLVEQFVFNQLEHTNDCKILAENIQIQSEKQTLGEIDALIAMGNQRIHLEIVYKFYLYDKTLGTSEVERWIGPNRNDSLIQKIDKLSRHQLPLLYSEPCENQLSSMGIDISKFIQKVCFKAQLFVPYGKEVDFDRLNKTCIKGFYLHINAIEDLKNKTFYMPSKLEWLLEPEDNRGWKTFEAIHPQVMSFIAIGKSPLLWIKDPNGTLSKCFVIWW